MTIGYEFPVSISLSEVQELIKDNPNFILVEKDDYIVANYVRSGNDTHPLVVDRATAILRELRGLVFHPVYGTVISRRYHKFFNFGEREDLMELDLSIPHRFLEKLDGSMIAPIALGYSFRLGTKMGITDVAMQAEEFVATHPNYNEFIQLHIERLQTPIFEWCSRKQRIVVDYPEDRLVLTAIRNDITGQYVSWEQMRTYADSYDIDMVQSIDMTNKSPEEVIQDVRAWETSEGVVYRRNDGHMMKIKADSYVALHRAKSLLDNERDVVGLILDEKTDDLMPLLNADDKERLLNFKIAVWNDIDDVFHQCNDLLFHVSALEMTRKDFALFSKHTNPVIRALCFAGFDKKSITDNDVVNYVKKNLGSGSAFERARNVLQTARWCYNERS